MRFRLFHTRIFKVPDRARLWLSVAEDVNMRLNIWNKTKPKTHGDGLAARIGPEQELRRTVLACLLWEDNYYEDGVSVAERLKSLVARCEPEMVAALALEARTEGRLRHVPLFLMRELARHPKKPKIAEALAGVIRRADELTEFLALYWREGRCPLSSQVKKGLALAFEKFDAYQLAKYDRPGPVRLRDALFLCHAKPKDGAQEALWKDLAERRLQAPDTWEVNLSAGAGKGETFSRLIQENKLGYLALLRNLRNMEESGVNRSLVSEAILARRGGAERVLPFRFVAAAKAAPRFERELDQALMASLKSRSVLPGRTVLIVDVSGSMYGGAVSRHSDLDRARAACALAAVAREICEEPVIYATAGDDRTRIHQTALVPPRRGLALVEAIYGLCQPLGGGGIFLKQVMDHVYEREKRADRVIVITDEQDCSNRPGDAPAQARLFAPINYMINVASYKNGIGYGRWMHIDGFSEAVVDYIQAYEAAGFI